MSSILKNRLYSRIVHSALNAGVFCILFNVSFAVGAAVTLELRSSG